MTRGYWIWKTIGAENRWSRLGMAMFRPFLAILGIVYDISFLSSKNDLPSTEHVFINKNRDNSATNIGEHDDDPPWLGQRDSRWQDLAGVAWLGASGCWLSRTNGRAPWIGVPLGWQAIRFLFEQMEVFGFFSDFSGFWDEFWKCFHGMTMSLELVDVMESSPVATMNHSIFWWILVEPYSCWGIMLQNDLMESVSLGDPRFFFFSQNRHPNVWWLVMWPIFRW